MGTRLSLSSVGEEWVRSTARAIPDSVVRLRSRFLPNPSWPTGIGSPGSSARHKILAALNHPHIVRSNWAHA